MVSADGERQKLRRAFYANGIPLELSPGFE